MQRKLTLVAMGMLLAISSIVLGAAPTAVAASHFADIRLKGPANSAYTQGLIVSQAGTAGTTLTYTFEIKNTGPSVAQFKIRVVNDAATLELYDGSLQVTPLAGSTDGYYTKALAPGKTQVLTGKLTVRGEPAYQTSVSHVYLYGVDGFLIDQVIPRAERAAPVGTTAYDMAVKSGGQKTVGNGQNDQVSTAATITPTGTATFNVTLKNNSASPAAISFRIISGSACGNFTATVKQGATNITASAFAGTYSTATLNPQGQVALTVSIKTSGASCGTAYWAVQSGGGGGVYAQRSEVLVNLTG